MSLLLKNLTWQSENEIITGDIRIHRGAISEISDNLRPLKSEKSISFNNHFVYPGLINAHDHLEMNLYPRLGKPPYPNYIAWGNDIYKPKESPVREIQKVDIKDRLLWGGIKNLISGVTTVVHHNPWHRFLSSGQFPVKVLKNYTWAHSLGFDKKASQAFPKKNIPYIIHAAEGTDQDAFEEVFKLHELGLLKSNTVLIHGVALNRHSISLLEQAHASLVWCPSSNYFLFNKTAPIQELTKIKIALGSDSTLTGLTTFFDEMQAASQTQLVNKVQLYRQVTINPAQIFDLPQPSIEVGKPADLFILPNRNDYVDNLIHGKSSLVELLLISGEPRFCDHTLANELSLKKNFATVEGVSKWFCVDVHKLKSRIRKVTGNVVEENPLWKLIE